MLTLLVVTIFLIICTVAWLSKSFGPHTVWGHLFCFSISNILLRYIYIDFGIGLEHIDPWRSFLFELTINKLEVGALLYLAITIIVAVGFLSFSSAKNINFWVFCSGNKIRFCYSRSILTLGCLLGLSVSSLFYFISKHSGSSSGEIQDIVNYRGTSDDLGSYQADGPLRFLINTATLIGLTSYYFILDKKIKSRNQKFVFNLFLIVSILTTAVMSVFSQSRSGFALALINYLLLYRVVIGRWWSMLRLVLLVSLIAIVFEFMTINRAGSGVDSAGDATGINKIITLFVMNPGGMDISKTILIIDKYKSTGQYLLGESLISILWSYIPRTFWQNKPVNLDTQIAFEVYGATVFGSGAVPPGIPAELFINFSYVGMVVGLFFVGCISKCLHNDFLVNRGAFMYPVYYVSCTNCLLYTFMGSGFTSALMSAVSNYVVLYIIVKCLFKFEILNKNDRH